MRAFRLLALRRLRQQPLRAAVGALAVAGGVALAVAVLVTSASIDRSITDFGRSLAGPAPLRIVGATTRGGLSLDSVAAAAAVPGVEAVVPLVQVVSVVDDGDEPATVLVLGADCRAEALVGAFGCTPELLAGAGDRPLLVGSGVAPGSLRTDLGRVDLAGVPATPLFDGLNDGRVVVYALDAAARAFAMEGRVDVAYVLPGTAAAADLAAAAGPQNAVLGALDPPPVVGAILATVLPLFSMLSMFGLATGAVLVHNTVSLSIEERRRQLAVAGALGASPGFVRGTTVAEAAVLGTVGGALGVLGGIAVAGPIVDGMAGFTVSEAGIELTRHVPASAAVLGVVLGTVVAGLAALGPARRALRVDVAAELSGRGGVEDARPARLARRLALWGAVAGAGLVAAWVGQRGGALEPWQAVVAPLGFLAVATAVGFVGAATAPLTLGLLARLTGRSRRPSLRLGLAELAAEPRRAGVMALAVAAPIIVAFTTDGFVASAMAGISASIDERPASVSVATADVEGQDAYLPPAAVAAVAALPGVAAVHPGVELTVGHRAGELIAVAAYGGIDLADLDDDTLLAGTPTQADFDAGGALIGPGLARSTGARPGGSITLPTPGGLVEVPVIGITRGGDFGGRSVELSLGTLTALYGTQPAAFHVAEAAPGVDEDTLADTVEANRAAIDPAVETLTTPELLDVITDSIEANMVPFRAMQQGLTFVAFVAVLTTFLLVGLQRRRQQGLLAAVGATPSDLAAVVAVQAGATWLASVANAVVLGPLTLWAMVQVLPVVLGYRNPFTPDWGGLAAASLTAAVVVGLAVAWPVWRAGRTPVLESLRYE